MRFRFDGLHLKDKTVIRFFFFSRFRFRSFNRQGFGFDYVGIFRRKVKVEVDTLGFGLRFWFSNRFRLDYGFGRNLWLMLNFRLSLWF